MPNGMPASRMRVLARTRRWPMVAGGIRNAAEMSSAVRPRMVCRISGARMPRSIAGCAQANIRERRRGGHSLRAQRARQPWQPRPHASLPVALGLDDRTDLDRAVFARRAALGPGNCLVEIGDRDKEIARELFLGVRVGAIEHLGLA